MSREMVVAIVAVAVALSAGGVAGWALVSGPARGDGDESRVRSIEAEVSQIKAQLRNRSGASEERVALIEEDLTSVLQEAQTLKDRVKQLEEELKKVREQATAQASAPPSGPSGQHGPGGRDPRDDERAKSRQKGVLRILEHRRDGIEKFAERHEWPPEKKRDVLAIVDEHDRQIREMFESFSPGEQMDRRRMMEQFRDTQKQMMESLLQVLSEDELKELRAILMPRPPRRPGDRRRPRGNNGGKRPSFPGR